MKTKSILVLFFALWGLFTQAQTVEIAKSVSNSSPAAGTTIFYTLNFRCASTTSNCENVVITDVISTNLTFSGATSSLGGTSFYDPNSNTLSVSFSRGAGAGLNAGDAGQVVITVIVPSNTPTGTNVSNTGAISSSNAGTKFSSVALTTTGNVTATLTPKAATCQANGEIAVSGVSGGCAPYKYALIAGPGVPLPVSYVTSTTFTGLQAGTFTISIIDCNGGEKTFTTTVSGTYTLMDYTLTPTTTCSAGTATGSLVVTGLTGGSAPYRYRITSPAAIPATGFQSSGTFSGLTPGTTYTAQVWDACDNFQTRTITVPAGSTLTVSDPVIKKETCDGKYTATYTSNGANGTVTYSITAGPDQVGTSNATGVFQLTPGGTYTIQAKDNCGTISTKTTKVNTIMPVADAFGTIASACTGMGGGAFLYVDGGVGPYTGTLTNNCGGANPTFTLLNDKGTQYVANVTGLMRPCTYTFTATDKCGVAVSKTFDLIVAGGENLFVYTEVLCPNASNLYGFKLGVGFGPPYTPSRPFTFEVKNSAGAFVAGTPLTQQENELNPYLPGGTYTYKITDNCGTFRTGTFTLGTYVLPTLELNTANTCINSGQVNLIGTSNNTAKSERQFKIIAGPDRINEVSNAAVFSNLQSGGTYTFEFYDGCNVATKQITVPPYKQATFEVTFGALCGSTTACIQAFDATGGLLPLQYEIIALNSTGGLTRPMQSDSLFCGLGAGQYNVRGFDACQNSNTFLAKIGTLIKPVINIPSKYCTGETIRLRATQCVYGATYTWFRDGVAIYTGSKHFIDIINSKETDSGTYTVKVFVPNSNGAPCEFTSDGVLVIVNPNLIITNPAIVCGTGTVNLTAVVVTAGSDAGTLTFWKDAAATQILDATTGSADAIKISGTYYIKLVTTDGCTVVKPVVVKISPIPTAPTASVVQPTCFVSTGTISVTAPTGATYSFDNGATYGASATSSALPAGTYQVKIKNTDGCESPATAVVINAQASCFGSIGDLVFLDKDGSNTQTAGDSPLAGVTVNLLDATGAIIATTQTGADGKYIFSNLSSGTYSVQFVAPAGQSFVTAIQGGDATKDSDAGVGGKTGTYTIDATKPVGDPARDITSVDAGLKALIFDLGFKKELAAGQTATVVAGSTITYTLTVTNKGTVPATSIVLADSLSAGLTLSDANWTAVGQIATLNTPIAGPIAPGATVSVNITVKVSPTFTGTSLTNYAQLQSAKDDKGNVNPTDPNSTPGNGFNNGEDDASSISVTVNKIVGSIGDSVFIDNNGDNVQDAGDSPIGGVKVYLLNNTGAKIDSTTTGTDGKYLFANLPLGTYSVQFVAPAGQTFVTPLSGTDLTKDSDAGANGTTAQVTLTVANPNVLTLDAGIKPIPAPLGSIGDIVFIDNNGDNVQDAGDSPAVGVKVYLLNAAGVKIDSTTTGTDGKYLFANLPLGTYSVQFVAPAGQSFVTPLSGTDPTKDSDAGINGTTAQVTLTATTPNVLTLDAGLKQLSDPQCPTAPPTSSLGPNVFVCRGEIYPTLTALVAGTGTVDWYKTATGGVPVATGTLEYKPAGNVTVSDTFYLASRSTLASSANCPTITERTRLIVMAQTCADTVDLALRKLVDKKLAKVGDLISYTIKVWNQSGTNATGVEVSDSLNAGVRYESSTATRGSYDSNTKIWTIGNIAANGDTVSLTIQVRVIAEGVWFNTAQITKADQKDKDSTPGNNKEGEDDLDRVCFSVPMAICSDQKVEVRIPSAYLNVVWSDGQTGNVATFSKAGIYNFTATNGSCPAGGCCPVIVELKECCPVDVCVPFTIKRGKAN